MRKILIISNTIDYHADAIIKELRKLNEVDYFRLNTDRVHKDYDLSIFPNNNSFKIYNKTNEKYIESEELTTVWWRRPEDLNFEYHMIPKYVQKFVDTEYYLAFQGLISCIENSDIHIVSHPLNLKKAACKIRQQITAKRLGFKLPKQLISNSFNTLAKQEYIKNCIIKPIDSVNEIKDKDGIEYILHANLLTKKLFNKLKNNEIELQIQYTQERIKHDFEIRVTCFNGIVYPYKITGDYFIDWRRVEPDKLKLEYYDNFPLNNLCLKYLDEMGLKFGAFDFIENEKGIFFLECNPNGQFLFLDIQNKRGIATNFAYYLAYGNK